MAKQKTTGDLVREVRGERTRRDVAAAAGITEQTVYRIECGAANPDVETLRKLAAAMGVTVASLIGEAE